MTFNDILIEQDTEIKISVCRVLDEIKDMISCALSSVRRCVVSSTIILPLMYLSTAPESLIIEDSETTVQLDVFQPRPTVELSIASNSDTQNRLEGNLQQLRELENGWDGYSALKPKNEAIKQVAMLIAHLDESVLSSCALFPSNDAGVYIQGKLAKGRLTIFVDGEVMAYMVKGKDSQLSATDKINAETISYLNRGLKMYI